MYRRDAIKLLSAAAASHAWPAIAFGQTPKIPKVGFLYPGLTTAGNSRLLAFREGLRNAGWGDRQVEIEARFAESIAAKNVVLAEELVSAKVDVLAPISFIGIEAARAATKTIPIVAFDLETDPVAAGIAATLARPGGNVTGVYFDYPDFSSKWMELLKEAIPQLSKVVVVRDPSSPSPQLIGVESASRTLGVQLDKVIDVVSLDGLDAAFRSASERRPDAVLILSSPLFGTNPGRIAELTAKHRLPAITLLAAVEIRTRCQCEDRQGFRHRDADVGFASRRRGDRVNRREAIKLLGVAAASSICRPSIVRAQAQPIVGFLGSVSFKTFTAHVDGFLEGFKESGFVDGRNVKIEYRWAEGRFERLPAFAAELVHRPVDLLVTVGGNVAALAAKRATSAIPIVFLTADDPVASGLAASLSRPGGNMTGVTWLGGELGAKNLELMRDLLPSVSVIGVLLNPTRPTAEAQLKNAQDAARAVGRTLRVIPVSAKADIDQAFELARLEKIGALFIAADPLFLADVDHMIELASRSAIPTVYFLREFVVGGGLMSYGANLVAAAKLCGNYAGRILKGAKPAELPIQQSAKVELVINLKTAKTLGLTLPITLLGRADEVIE